MRGNRDAGAVSTGRNSRKRWTRAATFMTQAEAKDEVLARAKLLGCDVHTGWHRDYKKLRNQMNKGIYERRPSP
jgi:hypothetical protein